MNTTSITNTLLTTVCCFLTLSLTAQSKTLHEKYQANAKVLYQTIELADDVKTISVNINENQEFDYEYWEGNEVLIEQAIELENLPRQILDYWIQQNRYQIHTAAGGGTLQLTYHAKTGKKIVINEREVYERVALKLLVPKEVKVQVL